MSPVTEELAVSPAASEGQPSVARRLLQWSNVLALVILLVVAGLASPYFFETRNIMNVLRGASPLAIVAMGMTVVIISRGVDLSIGSIVGASALAVAVLAEMNPAIGIVAALATGTALGAVNGILITQLRLQPFIATLAMLIFARGIVYISTDGANVVVSNAPEWFTFIGSGYVGPVPTPILIAGIIWAVLAYVLKQTRFGRHVFAVGANEEAARLYGIPVNRIKIAVYALCGLTGAIAGIILVSRLTVAEPNAGQLMELDAISAALIGGTTFDGGVGSIHGTILGALILAILGNVLNLLGVSPFVQMLLQGVIIVVAVVIADLRQRVR